MKKIILVIGIVIFSAAAANAETFTWTRSPSTDVAGYRLYTKNGATGALTQIGSDIAGANTTTATVTVPEPAGTATCTVVAKAYDQAGNLSVESNEAQRGGSVVVWRDVTPPTPPSLLQVLEQLTRAVERIATALEK